MKLINKSALVAEIEKCYNECLKRAKITDSDYWDAKADAYRNVLAILNDTLEVKEVDLEKEWKEFLKDGDVGFKEIAKHFFKLGMRSSITEEDCKLIWNIGDEIPPMSEEDFYTELLKRFKARKGEKV